MSQQVSTRGIAYWKHMDETLRKGVYESPVPNWNFIYQNSLTRDPNFWVGDSCTLPDGREYRYGKSGSALSTVEACHFNGVGTIPWVSATVTVPVGATSLVIPAATHAAAIAVDELRGGYVHINGSVTDAADSMFRGIVGNDYSAIGAAITIYLDGATDVEIDTSSAYEVFENPYADLRWGLGAPLLTKAGVPASYVSATATYFWVQVRGPRWCNTQTGVHSNTGSGCMWRGDGSLEDVETALGISTVPDVDTTQYAGHRILGGYTGNGPLFMLQG